MKKELAQKRSPYARLRDTKNKFGYCWSAFAIVVNKNGEKYCPGVYNLKAPIMSPMRFGMYHK